MEEKIEFSLEEFAAIGAEIFLMGYDSCLFTINQSREALGEETVTAKIKELIEAHMKNQQN